MMLRRKIEHQMIQIKNIKKIHFQDLKSAKAHTVIIDNLMQRYPVIIEGIKDVAKYRDQLS